MMMEGTGFEVINLGINHPVENCLKSVETVKVPMAKRQGSAFAKKA